ncbi:hypothetical protein [Oscillibacter sp.]|uniref:hypothetical protein n=1 Tax=Oscillibacter sp. TaxID=1945593 RepID=UPI0028B0C46C|nr:hypothetical protein [Oscillibacter sp.]
MHNALAESGATSKLNGNQLKLIAILAMTIDHLAYALMFQKDLIPFQNDIFDQTSVM